MIGFSIVKKIVYIVSVLLIFLLCIYYFAFEGISQWLILNGCEYPVYMFSTQGMIKRSLMSLSHDENISSETRNNILCTLDDKYSDLKEFEPTISTIIMSDTNLLNTAMQLYLKEKLSPKPAQKQNIEEILWDTNVQTFIRIKAGLVLIGYYDLSDEEKSKIDIKLQEWKR